ncbi:UDP-N-acetylglucosamine transferase subunit alg14 [Penicillium canariense]|uniref:UDP-N-acetylglucosamine transferase subunit ALG14 n=1 Tax=Penicillium canariense TaxID=189055 RepID=A0A9W9HW94_9EURO|nr:UDP-N-acetylglucosamine transferase subunit alg14 [Penicillium canariense]KAJ5157475.1 UDP-N-acetylglucosamine transferase subunit alg14 [Penicillium canariense]
MASTPQILCELSLKILAPLAAIGFLVVLTILLSLAISQNASIPKVRQRGTPVHILVVLGSGGHTAEMLYMLENTFKSSIYTYRTYVVSSGDALSAQKAVEFEDTFARKEESDNNAKDYNIVTIPRARRVHQSYLTAPYSTLRCFWACLLVLGGRHPAQRRLPAQFQSSHPDIIITNGPAVAVCMLLAAKLIRSFIFVSRWAAGRGSKPDISRLRTVYVESWARVRTLSTSGFLLLPVADKFLVQWPTLAGRRAWWGMKKTEYCGWVVV